MAAMTLKLAKFLLHRKCAQGKRRGDTGHRHKLIHLRHDSQDLDNVRNLSPDPFARPGKSHYFLSPPIPLPPAEPLLVFMLAAFALFAAPD